MSFLARLLPFQYYIGAAVLAMTLTGLGAQTWRLHSAQADLSQERAAWATERARADRIRLDLTSTYRAEESRRIAAQTEIVNATIVTAQAVAADAALALDSHERLLQRVDALAARARAAPSHPAAAQGSAPAAAAELVLADVLGRIDARAGQLGEYADQARTAGLACQRSYEALTR